MTAPDRTTWHELLRFVTDPSGQKALLGDPGYLRVGLGGRSAEEMQTLLTVLEAQTAKNGVPFTRKDAA